MKHNVLFSNHRFTRLIWALGLAAGLLALVVGPALALTWVNHTTGLGSNSVYGVYTSGGTLYAATVNDGGVSISTNGGDTFTNKTIANGLGSNHVYDIYASGSMVYAATPNGLSISTDGGNSFTNKTTDNGLGNNDINGVYASGSTIYAATWGDGLSISTNGGNSFTTRTNANSGLGDDLVYNVYASGGTIYAATWGGGLSISTNGGITFTNRTTVNGLGSNRLYNVYASGSAVYAATDNGLSISTNGGNSFTNKTTVNGLGSDDVYNVYASGGIIYAATDGGLSISMDGGNSFINETTVNGLGSNTVWDVYVSGGKVYAATDGGVSITDAPLPLPQLRLVKAVNPATATPGQAVTYTIAFSNSGIFTATNVVITDMVSANIVNAAVISSGVTLTPVAGSRYVWHAPDLGQNQGGVITLTGVLARPLAAGVFTNTVTMAVSGTSKLAEAPLTVENVAPVANAGPDQSRSVGQTITLDGSGSADDNGDALTYGWSQTGGPAVSLSSAGAINPTFTAPGSTGVLTFTLLVTDSWGLAASTPGQVIITITDPAPHIAVLGNGAEIANGDSTPATSDHTDFGSVTLGQAFTRTFTIRNNGVLDLSISSIGLSGAGAGDFGITGLVTPTTIISTNATTFQVRFTPALTGTRAATVTIANNDAGKNPYNFAIQGIGTAVTGVKIYLPIIVK